MGGGPTQGILRDTVLLVLTVRSRVSDLGSGKLRNVVLLMITLRDIGYNLPVTQVLP